MKSLPVLFFLIAANHAFAQSPFSGECNGMAVAAATAIQRVSSELPDEAVLTSDSELLQGKSSAVIRINVSNEAIDLGSYKVTLGKSRVLKDGKSVLERCIVKSVVLLKSEF